MDYDLHLLARITARLGPIHAVAVRCPRCREKVGLTIDLESKLCLCRCGFVAGLGFLLEPEAGKRSEIARIMEEKPRRR